MTAPAVDPLSAPCGYCHAPAGTPCGVRGFGTWRARPAVRPHGTRMKLAQALAAHADPALDAFWPSRSPCLVCGSGLLQRHRVVDAIAEHLAVGEDPEDVVAELSVSLEAVGAVQGWMDRWPGVWQ